MKNEDPEWRIKNIFAIVVWKSYLKLMMNCTIFIKIPSPKKFLVN